jgi:hypothetical protein
MTPLTPSEKEQAAIALKQILFRFTLSMRYDEYLEWLQAELAKVGLAIQPISQKDSETP